MPPHMPMGDAVAATLTALANDAHPVISHCLAEAPAMAQGPLRWAVPDRLARRRSGCRKGVWVMWPTARARREIGVERLNVLGEALERCGAEVRPHCDDKPFPGIVVRLAVIAAAAVPPSAPAVQPSGPAGPDGAAVSSSDAFVIRAGNVHYWRADPGGDLQWFGSLKHPAKAADKILDCLQHSVEQDEWRTRIGPFRSTGRRTAHAQGGRRDVRRQAQHARAMVRSGSAPSR